jgi:hypothetical protein
MLPGLVCSTAACTTPWTCLSYNGFADSGLSVLLTVLPPEIICSSIYSSLCCPRTRLFCTVAACAAPERCSIAGCATWRVCMGYSSLCCTRTCPYIQKPVLHLYVSVKGVCAAPDSLANLRILPFYCFIFRFASWDSLCYAPFLLLSPKLL